MLPESPIFPSTALRTGFVKAQGFLQRLSSTGRLLPETKGFYHHLQEDANSPSRNFMEALIGAIIGGLIASIAPAATVIADHLRWKREAKLIHLKAKRDKLEHRFQETLEQLSKAMARNTYPPEMTSDIMIMLPKEVSDRYLEFLEEKDKLAPGCRQAHLEIATKMKEHLIEIDEYIEALVSD